MNDEHDTIIDDEIDGVIDETINTVMLLRSRLHGTNAARELDAVTTLIGHLRSRLPDLVADCRHQANTWAEIAGLLGVNRPGAVIRYAPHARKRRQPPELD